MKFTASPLRHEAKPFSKASYAEIETVSWGGMRVDINNVGRNWHLDDIS